MGYAFGEYPPEYDAKVHGRYFPGRYYGKPDTKFGEVKLAELPGWLARRNKTPSAVYQACGRAWWRFNLRWNDPIHAGIAGPIQIVGGMMLFFYLINYSRYTSHRNRKYHW